MDGNQFDAISRSLATAGTRRGILNLLVALPVVGALLTVREEEQAEAKRHHRKSHGKPQRRHANKRQQVHEQQKQKKNKKNKKNKRHQQQACVPESAALTCAGRCGQIPNLCGTLIDCGACACPVVCPVCQTCNAITGDCEANPAFLGLLCAAPGQVCQASGACTCDDASCPAGQHCNGLACLCDETSCSRPGHFCLPNGACTCDDESCPDGQRCKRSVCVCDATSCPSGCCAGDGSCQLGTADDACGIGGNTCQNCANASQRCGGGGVPRTCGCASDAVTCAGKCGLVANNCCRMVDCTALCAGCCTEDGSCQLGTSNTACGADGETCFPCNAPDVCFEGACCTQTTCAALYQEMCRIPGDCDYGICGTFPDTCGGLDCGACGHPCFACENNKCVNIPGSSVCGTICCFSGCCVTPGTGPGTGLCGAERCLGGQCCPDGFQCCNARDGSFNSSCYNLSTYCQRQGVVCCKAGNTCCPGEECCTSDDDCPDFQRCIANGAPSNRGCCKV